MNIELTDSEPINLDEFSSDSVQQCGGGCGLCGKSGHNRRTCPDNVNKKPKITVKSKKEKRKSKPKLTIKRKTKSPVVSLEDFAMILNHLKAAIIQIICTSSLTDTFLDLGDFKLPKKGASFIDFNFNQNNHDIINSFCKVDSFKGLSEANVKSSEIDIEKFNISTDNLDKLNKVPKKRDEKEIKSYVYPLSSSKFKNGPKGGYGGLVSLNNDVESMKFVGALEKTNNIRKLIIQSKNNWRKVDEGMDPLYYHYVILEGTRTRNKETQSPVLGYIRLKRDKVLSDEIMLRIVIRKEGRGIGKTSLYEAIKNLNMRLKKIYSHRNFIIVAETNVDNLLGANAFTKWGFYKEDGGYHGVYKKPYGDVYRFTLSIDEALRILNPNYKTFKIPSINKLKYLKHPLFKRKNIAYLFNGLEDIFKKEITVRNFLSNVSKSLEKNGLFIVINKDSINMSKRMESTSGSFGNSLYNISYSSIDMSKNFGIKYKIISDTTRNEYLVRNEIFKTIASEYNLNEIYSETLDVFYKSVLNIPIDTEIHKIKTLPDDILEMLSLLRLTVFTHTQTLKITGLIPETETVSEKNTKIMKGGEPMLTIDKIIKLMKDKTPRIYYTFDDSRAINEGEINKIIGNKIIVIDENNNTKFPLKIDEFRFLNNDELKKWRRGSKNFRFVTNNIDLNVHGDRKKCIYLDNKDALWNVVENIDSWKPFVYRNEPNEKHVILYDKEPKSKYHFLVVPKHKVAFKDLTKNDKRMLESMYNLAIRHIRNNFINSRFKIGFQQGGGDQTQLHLHVISNNIKAKYRSKFSNPNFISVNTLISSLTN